LIDCQKVGVSNRDSNGTAILCSWAQLLRTEKP